MKVTVEGNNVLISAADGAVFEVRGWSPDDPDAGHLKDGATYRADDGCTWTRHGAHLVVTEPARSAVSA
jgi:hypothetical protein